MCSLKEYKNSHLKRLSGSFKIYINKENKFLHLPSESDIKVDLNFWRYIKTIKINSVK